VSVAGPGRGRLRPVPATGEALVEERARIRRGLRTCLVTFVAMRAGLTLVGLAAVALLPSLDPVGAPGWPATEVTAGWHHLFTAFERFDALWFLGIATTGYVDGNGSAAFFPGYPLAIRGLSPLIGGFPLAAAVLISNAAAFGSMVVLYFVTAGEYDEETARRSVAYLAAFPTAVFLVAPYSESLFLLLVLTSLWAARRGRWEIAGLAGAGATLTRNLGVLLVLPLVVEAVHQAVERRRAGDGRPDDLARSVVWALVPALGTLAYLAFWWRFSGDWLAPLHQQANWQREASFPLATVVAGTREAFRFPGVYPGGYHLLDWLLVTPALGAAVWVALRTRPVYATYAWASLLAPLSYIFAPRPFMSLPRFLLMVFPILWAPAVWARRRRGVHETWLAVSAAALGVVTLLFVTWYYVF
jgi:hypothetical protein